MIVNASDTSIARRGLPVVRVKPSREVYGYLVSEQPIWLMVHWSLRQYLCAGTGCPGCEVLPMRMAGYVVVKVDRSGSGALALLCFGPRTWELFQDQVQECGPEGFGGTGIRLTRSREKSPLSIEPTGIDGVKSGSIASPEYVLSCVARLHKLPGVRLGETVAGWEERTQGMRTSILSELTKQA